MVNLKSVDYIISAKHISPDGTAKGYYLDQAERIRKGRGVRLDFSSLDSPRGEPVKARIYQGQWIADCECTGASYVDPEFPVFFCFSCGNRANEGAARPVEFPKERALVEAAMLERPVDDLRGLTDADRAGMARPLIFVEGKGGLGRNWLPGETLADLQDQQGKPIEAWKKNLKKRK